MPNLIVLYSFLLNRYLLSSVHLGVRSCVRSKLWAWILNHPSLGLARLRWPKNCRSKQWHLHHLHSWCRMSAKSLRKNCIDEPPIQQKWDRLRKGVIFLVQRCVCVCFRMIDLLDQPPGSKRLNFFLETIVSQGKRIESPGVFTNECIYNDMSKANWLYRFKSACYLKKQERFKILSQVIVSSYIFHMYSKTIDRSGPMISHPDNIKDEVVPKKCLKPSPQQPLQVAFNEASRCSSKLPHSPRAVAVPRRMMVASASLSWKRARGIVRDAGI